MYRIYPLGFSFKIPLANTHAHKLSASEYINKYLNKHLQLRRGIISSARIYAL